MTDFSYKGSMNRAHTLESFKESRRSFATVELSEEKANAISSSRMDDRHAHLDAMFDE